MFKRYAIDYVDGGLLTDKDGVLMYYDDHLNVVKELQSRIKELEKSVAEKESYRTVLEVIAVGDSEDAQTDAAKALLSTGFWKLS